MIAGGGYSYEPGERRDPFKSLLAPASRPSCEAPGPRASPGC